VEQTGTGRGAGWVAGQLVLFAAIICVPRDLLGLPAWPEPLRRAGLYAGVLLGLLGVGIAGLGVRDLGTNLTSFPRPRERGTLVQEGLYGLVRHPIYCGVLLAALGWSLARASTVALLLTLALGLFFDRKAAVEERWLAARFPEYTAYRKRVKKLIPWLY
jgi:protein-S-isoprenylcysteine O-methyltransferase Ste14